MDEIRFWFAWAAVLVLAGIVAVLAWDILYVNDPTRRRNRERSKHKRNEI